MDRGDAEEAEVLMHALAGWGASYRTGPTRPRSVCMMAASRDTVLPSPPP